MIIKFLAQGNTADSDSEHYLYATTRGAAWHSGVGRLTHNLSVVHSNLNKGSCCIPVVSFSKKLYPQNETHAGIIYRHNHLII